MEEKIITMQDQQSIEYEIVFLFERNEEVLKKIDNGENLRTSNSLEGWADFAQLYLPQRKEFLDNPRIASFIYGRLEREYKNTLQKSESKSIFEDYF